MAEAKKKNTFFFFWACAQTFLELEVVEVPREVFESHGVRWLNPRMMAAYKARVAAGLGILTLDDDIRCLDLWHAPRATLEAADVAVRNLKNSTALQDHPDKGCAAGGDLFDSRMFLLRNVAARTLRKVLHTAMEQLC